MNQKLAAEYERNGVIVIEKLFSLKEVNHLKKKIHSYIKNNSRKLKGKEVNYIKKKVLTNYKI